MRWKDIFGALGLDPRQGECPTPVPMMARQAEGARNVGDPFCGPTVGAVGGLNSSLHACPIRPLELQGRIWLLEPGTVAMAAGQHAQVDLIAKASMPHGPHGIGLTEGTTGFSRGAEFGAGQPGCGGLHRHAVALVPTQRAMGIWCAPAVQCQGRKVVSPLRSVVRQGHSERVPAVGERKSTGRSTSPACHVHTST